MKEEQIEVRYAKRKRKYSSYIGEITPAVKDLVRHKFRANQPNELWVTDITEFCAGKDKLYFSPVIDCYDGKVVAWSASRFPDRNLVEVMLNQAVKTLSTDEIEAYKDPDNNHRLIIHTDRGGHYRGAMWIEKLEGLGISRSMSRKGNSGDNAACEGFFGRMKTEMYYGRKWTDIRELEIAIEEYINFYYCSRITAKFDGLTIKEHRDLVAKMSKKAS